MAQKKNTIENSLRIVDLNEQLELIDTNVDHLLNVDEIISQYPNLTTAPKTIQFDKQQLVESMKSVKGQQDNIELIVEETNRWIRKAKKRKPLVFMLAGTSGTGKTFTAKCLQSSLEKQGFKFIRLNMNEYHSDDGSRKLLGSPQGFVDSDKDAPLFYAHKTSEGKLVILFDEIEKAHPSLFLTIMALMDEGVLANGKGESFDFKKSIIIFTTNLAQDQLLSQKKRLIEQHIQIADRSFQDATKQILKNAGLPNEICGRINWLLVYNTLDISISAQIAMEKIRMVGKEYDFVINRVPFSYLEEVAQKCANNNEGARPIESEVRNKLEPIFQEAFEADIYNQNSPYDLNEHFQLVSSEEKELYPVDEIIIKETKIETFDKQQLVESLKSVKGQQDNIKLIVEETNRWIRKAKKNKPLVFMLAGTSGTGKTFTVETICTAMKDYKMVKLNMNEYHSEGDIWKLLGSSTGYIGSNQESPIFAAHRETSKLIILFDEIEKAHPSLFTTIMTLMEKGEMANGHGEMCDFKNSIIFFTTNLAMNELLKLKKESMSHNIDPSSQEFQDASKSILKSAGLKEEISGRLDWLLIYNTLNASIVAQIAMESIRKLGKDYEININRVSERFLGHVSKQCANNNEGARPINRMIINKLEPIFQNAFESGAYNSDNSLYDIDENFQIIPSNVSEIVSINDISKKIEFDQLIPSVKKNEALVIKLNIEPYFKTGYNYDDYRKATGLIQLGDGSKGSAFIITPDGYIITCAHCVGNGDAVSFIKDDDKSTYNANIVYCNKQIDIAILKIEAQNLPYLMITDSIKPLRVGSEVVVLGYPSGTDINNDISSFEGKVSSFNKANKTYQSDVLAAPGSSGGAFIAKKDGAVYGVLRAGYRETLNVEISVATDILNLLKQTDIIIEYI